MNPIQKFTSGITNSPQWKTDPAVQFAMKPTSQNRENFIQQTNKYAPMMMGMTGGVQPFEDFDTAVDLVRGAQRGSLEDVMAAHKTIMNEAGQQLTPQELRTIKTTPLDQLINLLQERIRPQEEGMMKK